jgi:NAD(P)-dependent dehydrogenase (short-subunit alcohol dehydrogenase family)
MEFLALANHRKSIRAEIAEVTRRARKVQLVAKWGRIVTIASSAGQIGSPRQGHYAAAKGGVIAMTKTITREYAKQGITANAIPPSASIPRYFETHRPKATCPTPTRWRR